MHGSAMAEINWIKDLGLVRSPATCYEGQYPIVIATASKVSGAIRRSFQQLWVAYSDVLRSLAVMSRPFWCTEIAGSYESPILMYWDRWRRISSKTLTLWKLYTQRQLTSLLTAKVTGLKLFSVLSLQGQRQYANMVLVFKAVHGLNQLFLIIQLGLCFVVSITCSGRIRLEQSEQMRVTSCVVSNFVSIRVSSTWNKFHLRVTYSLTLSVY